MLSRAGYIFFEAQIDARTIGSLGSALQPCSPEAAPCREAPPRGGPGRCLQGPELLSGWLHRINEQGCRKGARSLSRPPQQGSGSARGQAEAGGPGRAPRPSSSEGGAPGSTVKCSLVRDSCWLQRVT